jgi:ligand-binding sensor domain-containing protein
MKKNIILLLALTLLISFGCKKKYDIYTDSDTIYVDGANGSTASVKITANTNWVISSTAFKWLKMSPTEGGADETVVFTCSENMSAANRVAIVSITDATGNTVKQISLIQRPFSYGNIKLIIGAADGIYYSVDGGYTLTKQALNGKYVGSLVKTSAGIFAVSTDGIYKSPDGYYWEIIKSDTTVNCIAADNGNLFIGTSAGIFKSTDDGDNWTALPFTDFTNAIAVSGNNILAGSTSSINYSTNGGTTWSSALSNRNFSCVGISNTALYAGTTFSLVHGASGIWKSTDGTNWSNDAPLSDEIFSMLVTKKDSLYVGSGKSLITSSNRGFFKSYNGGTSWSNMNLNTYNITGLARYQGYLYAGTYNGLFVSTDDGNTWSKMNNTGISARAIIATNL